MAGRQLYTTQGRVKVWPLATHGRPEAAQFRGRKKATGGVNSFEGSGGNSGDQGGTTGGGETSRFLPLDAFSCRSKRKDGEALLHRSTAPHSLSLDYLALTSSLNAINHGFSIFCICKKQTQTYLLQRKWQSGGLRSWHQHALSAPYTLNGLSSLANQFSPELLFHRDGGHF